MRLQLDSSASGLADSGRVAPSAATEASPASRAEGSRGSNTDSIGLSGTSAALNRFFGERSDRIQQLTDAVRSGTYSVPSAAVSGAIVAQGFTPRAEG